MKLIEYINQSPNDDDASIVRRFIKNELNTDTLFSIFESEIKDRITMYRRYSNIVREATEYAFDNLSSDYLSDDNSTRDINLLRLKELSLSGASKEDIDTFAETYAYLENITKEEVLERINDMSMNIPVITEEVSKYEGHSN